MNLLSNPYDSIGQAHNDGLAYVIANIPANPTTSDWVNTTTTFMLTQAFPPANANVNTYAPVNMMEISALVASGFNGVFSVDKFKCQGAFSQKQLDFLDKLLNPNPTIPNADLAAFYLNIGYDIISASMLEEQKQILLIAAAVGYYSSTYWNTQINDPNSPWEVFIGNTGTSDMKKWVAGDIGGAVGGAIGGGITAALTTGGVGVLAGALIGALSCGIGGSITGALSS